MKSAKALLYALPVLTLACSQKPKPTPAAAQPAAPVSKPAQTKTADAVPSEDSRLKIQQLIAEAFRPVYFPFDQAELSQKSRALLSQAGDLLKREPAIKVLIEGNTDERGTEDYNLALGEKRAAVVQKYLTEYGIDAGRLTLISYGKEKPAREGHDESAWAANRRDDFKATF